MQRDCPFCRIVSGEAPAEVVVERERVLAFRDTRPQAPTHVLVIPKEHIRDITELGPAHAPLLVELFEVAREVAGKEGVAGTGFRVVANVGPHAGQSVFHLHLHVLGGRWLSWPPG